MRPSFTIRPTQVGDLPELVALLRAAFKDEGEEIGGTEDTEESLNQLMHRGETLLTLEVDGRASGFVYLDSMRRAAFKLAVAERISGHDLGRDLMIAAERRARELGWGRLLVGVMEYKKRLLDYYIKRGYEPTGETKQMSRRPGYFGSVPAILILSKQL